MAADYDFYTLPTLTCNGMPLFTSKTELYGLYRGVLAVAPCPYVDSLEAIYGEGSSQKLKFLLLIIHVKHVINACFHDDNSLVYLI